MEESLPIDNLESVFSYLNPLESIVCRRVCTRWRRYAGNGVMIVNLRQYDNSRNYRQLQTSSIGYITLSGRAQQLERDDNQPLPFAAAEPTRTRGHLSRCAELTDDARSVSKSVTTINDRIKSGNIFVVELKANGAIQSMRTGHNHPYHAALQIEQRGLPTPLFAIDISASTVHYCFRMQCSDGTMVDYITCSLMKGLSRSLRTTLEELDISNLQHLKEVSVRGCTRLRSLKLPKQLTSLDAGSCSELQSIAFPNGVEGDLRNLDLSGCRRLCHPNKCRIFHPSPPALMGNIPTSPVRSITHIDMSNVCLTRALDEVFCSAIGSTIYLESASFRYKATNEFLIAMSKSESASSGHLHLVDIAFSINVTDESVQQLARNAIKLERLNMRGCKGISPSCYNHVPIYLSERRHSLKNDVAFATSSTSSRKGDNIFHFCQGNKGKK